MAVQWPGLRQEPQPLQSSGSIRAEPFCIPRSLSEYFLFFSFVIFCRA